MPDPHPSSYRQAGRAGEQRRRVRAATAIPVPVPQARVRGGTLPAACVLAFLLCCEEALGVIISCLWEGLKLEESAQGCPLLLPRRLAKNASGPLASHSATSSWHTPMKIHARAHARTHACTQVRDLIQLHDLNDEQHRAACFPVDSTQCILAGVLALCMAHTGTRPARTINLSVFVLYSSNRHCRPHISLGGIQCAGCRLRRLFTQPRHTQTEESGRRY